MHKIKINILAIIGMMVAIGTVAFTAPKQTNLASYWFEVSDGMIEELIPSGEPNTQQCNALNSEAVCAIELKVPVFEGTIEDAEAADLVTGNYTRKDQ